MTSRRESTVEKRRAPLVVRLFFWFWGPAACRDSARERHCSVRHLRGHQRVNASPVGRAGPYVAADLFGARVLARVIVARAVSYSSAPLSRTIVLKAYGSRSLG